MRVNNHLNNTCIDLYLHLQNAHILKINQNILYCKVIHEKGPAGYVKMKVKNNRVAGCFKGGIKHKCLPSPNPYIGSSFPATQKRGVIFTGKTMTNRGPI